LPPRVELRPMRPEEYDAWYRPMLVSYAAEIGDERRLTPERARQAAAEELGRLLPDGLETPNHLLRMACDDGVPVGMVWMAIRTGDESNGAFVYNIEVGEEHRGRGYGRAIMMAAELECRSRGIAELMLNVFGHNTAAIRLYESLGYRMTSQHMRKIL
jgi:ribosomal protein S18 acetylase RimI-like enzyme